MENFQRNFKNIPGAKKDPRFGHQNLCCNAHENFNLAMHFNTYNYSWLVGRMDVHIKIW